MTVWQPGAEMQGGAQPGCRWGPRLSWGFSPPSMGTAASCAALTVSAQVPASLLPSHHVFPAWAAVSLQTRHMRMETFFSQLSPPHWMPPGLESLCPQLPSTLLHSAQGHRLSVSLLTGRGPACRLSSSLSRLAREAGKEESVCLLGPLKNPPRRRTPRQNLSN